MKKTLVTLALVAASAAAFAQGKVTFGNDSNHYFVLGSTLAADNALGGGVSSVAGNTASGTTGAIQTGPLPSGVTLVAALYAGTASGAETLQTKYALTGADWFQSGRMTSHTLVLTGVPGAAVGFFRLDVFDNAFASAALAAAAGIRVITPTAPSPDPGRSEVGPSADSDDVAYPAADDAAVNSSPYRPVS